MNEALDRFLIAQQNYYQTALEEIKTGKKKSHWMWFIFPQIAGLGYSETACYYAIRNLNEAKEFLADETLGNNLLKITETLLETDSEDIKDVVGYPDDMKLKSSMTLFSIAGPEYDVFSKVLDKFFDGEKDQRTLDILQSQSSKIKM